MKKPVRVAVTGAAGQIGYALLFRIASGEMLGKDQPVILQLLEIPDEKAQKALKGVMMELDDCAFPLLAGMSAHSDPNTAFKDINVALLVGARPRGPGMERKDLLLANAQIFSAQGKALDAVAAAVVGGTSLAGGVGTIYGAIIGALYASGATPDEVRALLGQQVTVSAARGLAAKLVARYGGGEAFPRPEALLDVDLPMPRARNATLAACRTSWSSSGITSAIWPVSRSVKRPTAIGCRSSARCCCSFSSTGCRRTQPIQDNEEEDSTRARQDACREARR